MQPNRKSLSDVLHAGGETNLAQAWDSTQAAADFKPLPRGEYVCHLTAGTLQNSKSKGTPGYKLEFTVLDGPHTGRKVWHDCWFTPAALPHSKRDLAKLGVTALAQLNRPLPPGMRCKVQVILRTDDDNIERNRVQAFDVLGIDKPEADPFAPPPATAAGNPPGEAAEPNGAADSSFDPGSF